MDLNLVALGVSVAVNMGLVGYLVYKGSGVNTVSALSDFKKAVVRMKVLRDRAGVDAATISAGIPSILELLNPPKV